MIIPYSYPYIDNPSYLDHPYIPDWDNDRRIGIYLSIYCILFYHSIDRYQLYPSIISYSIILSIYLSIYPSIVSYSIIPYWIILSIL